jgi:hypothetical protein
MLDTSVSGRLCVLLVVGTLGCTPVLDWREVRLPDSPLQALLPCKPSAQERRVRLANQVVRMTLLACEAGGQTWGLAHADVSDPALLAPAQAELLAAAGANIAAGSTGGGKGAGQALPLAIAGATPHAASGRRSLAGHRPDGQMVQMQVAVFAYGSQVHQATVLGPVVSAEAAEAFFAGLRFKP